MIVRLTWLELRRLVLGWRFVVGLVILSGLSVYGVYQFTPSDIVQSNIRFEGALTNIGDTWLPMTVPLVAGLVAAGSFAADRRRGYVPMVLARGLSRWKYLVAKGSAMAVSSMLVVLLGALVFFLAAVLMLPSGRTVNDRNGVDDNGNTYIIPVEVAYLGPSPALAEANPLLNDLLSLSMITVGAGALALTGLVVGALVPNEYIAAAVPLVLVIIGLFALFNWADAISPYTYMDVWIHFRNKMLPGTPLYVPFVYWLGFGALAFGIGGLLFTQRELD